MNAGSQFLFCWLSLHWWGLATVSLLPLLVKVCPSHIDHRGVLLGVLESLWNPSPHSALTDLVVLYLWSFSFSYSWPLLRCRSHVPCLLRWETVSPSLPFWRAMDVSPWQWYCCGGGYLPLSLSGSNPFLIGFSIFSYGVLFLEGDSHGVRGSLASSSLLVGPLRVYGGHLSFSCQFSSTRSS